MLAVGDDEFDAVYRAEFRRMTQSLFLVVGSTAVAEEIVQEAFARAWARWGRVSATGRPAAWIQTVAFRMALRAKRRAQRVAEAEAAVTSTAPSESAVVTVEAVLRQLSPMQRAVVALSVFEGLPIVDVAQRLGCRPSTARVHLHRARLRLAEAVTQEFLYGT
jgi:RNA polymerase sigma-70 factor (ECF subfamily)